MFVAHRTPAKKAPESTLAASQKTPEATEGAGPSEPKQNVRRSIGNWETGLAEVDKQKMEPRVKATQPPQDSQTESRRTSTKADKTPPPAKPKQTSRQIEARACLTRAKNLLGESRNIKAEIKVGVSQAVERLYRLVLEAEEQRIKEPAGGRDKENKETHTMDLHQGTVPLEHESLMAELLINIKEHSEAIKDLKQHTTSLTTQIKQIPPPIETEQLTNKLEQLRTDLNNQVLQQFTYVEALKRPKLTTTAPLHTIIISSDNKEDTGNQVIEKIRDAVDAKNSGIRVDRLRKAKDQKIVVACHSKEEIEKVSEAVKSKNLNVREAKNKDPLVIVRDVLASHTDEELVNALKKQNSHLLTDLDDVEFRAVVKYRRKARNPHTMHAILQVSPGVWQRLTSAGRIHVDLQRLRVEDQSPLVQCSMCLGYGHTRRLCTETTEVCSHCGGPHRGSDCADRLVNQEPTCCNCIRAKLPASNHNAFDQACPVRRRWDALARSSTAYC